MVLRTFLAIDFDSKLKEDIAGLQSGLRKYTLSGRWKYVDNFHLTLKFLDQINDRKIYEIDKVMEEICRSRESFELRVDKLGHFPGRDAIRVLWLGLGGDLGKLGLLQGDIEKGLQPLGFETEKREYRPHVTIAQDVTFSRSLDELAGSVDFTGFNKVSAEKVYLFKSEQITGKRVYTPIREYALKSR